MSDYPLTKCYSPRVIMNKYTGELVEVGCGVCKACLLNRARKASMLCAIEEAEHRYCMFVTLSYAPKYAPMMRPTISKDGNSILWHSVCSRLGEYGELVAVDNVESHQCKSLKGFLALLLPKTDPKHQLNGKLTYCSKRDMQLFMKRLRKVLKRYTDEKVRYYIVAEYGPKTFRAHYHLLLFYDDPRTQAAIRRAVLHAWSVKVGKPKKVKSQGKTKLVYPREPLGRIDMSLSRGKCTSYVAKYVNSSYSIPSFLGSLSVKPFALHSRFFAQGVYRCSREAIYEDAPEHFVQLSGELSGKYVEFMPWRSLACTFFPKCKGYNRKSDSELWRSYNILLEVKRFVGRWFDELSLPKIADILLDAIVNYRFPSQYTRPIKYTDFEKYLFDYFCEDIEQNPYVYCHSKLSDGTYDDNTEKYAKVEYYKNQILSQLYTSKHFLTYCCDNQSLSERRRKFEYIKRFWSHYDYTLLYNMYQSQQDNASEMSDFKWYYVNKVPTTLDEHMRKFVDLSELGKERFYQEFVIQSDADFLKSIKHKELNDANLIYCNY